MLTGFLVDVVSYALDPVMICGAALAAVFNRRIGYALMAGALFAGGSQIAVAALGGPHGGDRFLAALVAALLIAAGVFALKTATARVRAMQ